MGTDEQWKIWVDTGGTFTDCLGIDPEGVWHRTKVLSSSGLRGRVSEVVDERTIRIEADWQAPDNFINGFDYSLLGQGGQGCTVGRYSRDPQAITFSEACVQSGWEGASFEVTTSEEPPVLAARLLTGTPAGGTLPPMELRLATTRGTNALLERKGARFALFITRGFGDLMRIGTQQRPDLFALDIRRPAPLYEEVIEVDERIDAEGKVRKALDVENIGDYVRNLPDRGITAAAVVFINSYRNASHEDQMRRWLLDIGFEWVSVSSGLSRFIGMLPRAETTLVNTCLAPIMDTYLDDVQKHVHQGALSVMTSAGGLMTRDRFRPKDGLLSGPAAGVVGAAAVGREAGYDKIISFDMGGTSSDVSRYDADLEYVFEHRVGDARLMAPAVAIETVAAGGGSICSFDGQSLRVGPESAGASPGPACYGAGGPVTVTDINVLAGRLDERNFHIPIDKEAARQGIEQIRDRVSDKEGRELEVSELLEGFLEIANQRMAGAIEKVSLRKGYDPREYALISFGGAGGQHCCAIARLLGIDTVAVPEDAGLLSAYGLGHAVMEHIEEQQVLEPLETVAGRLPALMNEVTRKAVEVLAEEAAGMPVEPRRQLLFMRLKGQESTLEVHYDEAEDPGEAFRAAYRRRYGHGPQNEPIELESVRVVASTRSEIEGQSRDRAEGTVWEPLDSRPVQFGGTQRETPVYERSAAPAGASVRGPALILDPYSTVYVEPGWRAVLDDSGALLMRRTQIEREKSQQSARRAEAVDLELYTHRFTSIVEKMGEMLQRTALSVNVKERHDFSCALLNPDGELVVNAPHIPVHLGALGICVRRLREQVSMQKGDVVITNHPAYGGSHLPDVTIVTPVFDDQDRLIGYVANRAHHAEIGGTRPGSMPPAATSLAEEGVVISPAYLVKGGESRFPQIRRRLESAEYPTRNIEENMADLHAQNAANRQGAEALRKLAAERGLNPVHHYMDELKARAARSIRQTLGAIPNGIYESRELLDDGTPICARWEIHDGAVTIDFAGSGPVHPKNLNATPAIVNSVVMYVLRVLVDRPLPLNEGLMEPVELRLPEGLLNPHFDEDPYKCPAVVGGNVEISQRLTDTLLKPFERIACGQGTMNNVLFGNDTFGYYETVGGGSGAGPGFHGADGVHQHMTNTRGTDPEILEQRYPVRLDRYTLRAGSGGEGSHKGGDGIIREMTFLEPVELSVLTQHRVQRPYGLKGGGAGQAGAQWVIRRDGSREQLASSDARSLAAGDRFVLHTPGGGGYGKPKPDSQTNP